MIVARWFIDQETARHIEFRRLGYSIPYQIPGETETIIPRDDIMQQIDAVFKTGPAKGAVSFRFTHLCGKSGIGKTTLAKHYIQLHKDDISFVFWVWAESWETVAGSYLDFANNLVTYYATKMPRERVEERLGVTGIGEMVSTKSILHLDKNRVMSVVRAVKDWLMQPDNSNWLVVFDHVEPVYNVQEFIPLTLSGRVILTSNVEQDCTWGRKISVQSMSEEQALQLLQTVTGSVDTGKDNEGARFSPRDGNQAANEEAVTAAKKLIGRLDGHPRSIAQAATAIHMKKLLISDYQAMLEQVPGPVLFGSAIDQSPSSKFILRISSLLSSSAIPTSLFSKGLFTMKSIPTRFSKTTAELKGMLLTPSEIAPINANQSKEFQSQDNLDGVLQHLIDLRFIHAVESSESSPSSPSSSPASTSSTTTTCFTMDSDARDFVRQQLSGDERSEHAWLACNVCAEGVRQVNDESSTLQQIHSFGRVVGPHAKVCYDDCYPIIEGPPELESISWNVLGNVCMTQGATTQAIGCFELALQHGSSIDALEKIQTSLSLSQLLESIGQKERSIQVLKAVELESVDDALGFRLARAKAAAKANQGELSDAEYQFEVLEHEQEKALGPAHAETVGTVQMLAATLHKLGKNQDAHLLYRRVYVSYQNTFGQAHPMTLGSLDDLAKAAKEVYSIDEAEALYKKSIEIKTHCLGEKHPRTALAIQNLASIDDLRARYSAAQVKYQKALDILLPTLGRGHPHCTSTMENKAYSLHLQGHSLQEQIDEAASLAATRTSTKRRLSNTRGSGMAARVSEAVSLDANRQRAFQEAEKLYLEVVSIKKAARDMYTEESLVATVSDLIRMYEMNSFFEAGRADKIDAVKNQLRESRRRGTV